MRSEIAERKNSLSERYLHGYRADEQKRLRAQARTLEQRVFQNVEYSAHSRILEVGSGVGAQTEILLERFPTCSVTSVDLMPEQTDQARCHFKRHRFASRVEIVTADAADLPMQDCVFDGAFICWLLEHVPDPVGVLSEVRRCLKPGATVFINEVFNQLFYLGPKNSAFNEYWRQYNELQEELAGSPQIGANLGHLLLAAGFKNITTEVAHEHWDIRECRQRRWMTQYLENLLMSASPALLERKKITEDLIAELKEELSLTADSPNGVLFFAWIKATARV